MSILTASEPQLEKLSRELRVNSISTDIIFKSIKSGIWKEVAPWSINRVVYSTTKEVWYRRDLADICNEEVVNYNHRYLVQLSSEFNKK